MPGLCRWIPRRRSGCCHRQHPFRWHSRCFPRTRSQGWVERGVGDGRRCVELVHCRSERPHDQGVRPHRELPGHVDGLLNAVARTPCRRVGWSTHLEDFGGQLDRNGSAVPVVGARRSLNGTGQGKLCGPIGNLERNAELGDGISFRVELVVGIAVAVTCRSSSGRLHLRACAEVHGGFLRALSLGRPAVREVIKRRSGLGELAEVGVLLDHRRSYRPPAVETGGLHSGAIRDHVRASEGQRRARGRAHEGARKQEDGYNHKARTYSHVGFLPFCQAGDL